MPSVRRLRLENTHAYTINTIKSNTTQGSHHSKTLREWRVNEFFNSRRPILEFGLREIQMKIWIRRCKLKDDEHWNNVVAL